VSIAGRGSYQADTENRGLADEVERLRSQTLLSWDDEQRLLERAGVGAPRRVLELGCGPGFVTERLLQWLPDAHVTAVDVDAGMVDRAQRTVAAHGTRATVLHGSCDALPLPDASADFILARYLFQHLPDPDATAREALRLLAPGGWLAVVDVDAELWGVAEPVFREVMPIYAKTGRFQAARGGNRLIGRRLWRILRRAGFEQVELDAFVYHSDVLGLEPFAPQLDPSRLLPLVRAGAISGDEFAIVQRAYERFMDTPDAYVLMVGLAALGRKP
jgi:ubiquinone/menaquinone biosynthesis C-methylase UbiE